MMRISPARIIPLMLLLAFFCFPAVVFASQNDVDSVIARAWTERAHTLLQGDTLDREQASEANQALMIASDFSPGSSDILYLRSRLLTSGYNFFATENDETSGLIRSAYTMAGESLRKSGGKDVVSYSEKAVHWASLSLRLKDYRGLLDTYESMPRGEQLDPLLIYAAARSNLYLGRKADAAGLAGKGEVLSGPETNLRLLSPAFSPAALPAFRALAVAAGDDEALNTLDSANRWGEELGYALLPWVLSGWIAPGEARIPAGIFNEQSTAAVRLIGFESGDEGFSVNGNDIPDDFISDLAFLRRIGETSGLNLAALLDEKLLGFTGLLVSDSDYDGYPEESIRLLNGRPDRRLIDTDQDGLYEWEITYSSGMPEQIRMENGRTIVIYDAGVYPEVLTVIQKEILSVFTVSFFPGAFEWSPFGGDTLIEAPNLSLRDDDSLWKSARRMTVERRNPQDGTFTKAITVISEGWPLKAMETCFSDGDRHPLWARELLYEDGIPVAGRRSFNRDESKTTERLWEIYERYEEGRLVGFSWDPEMDGAPLYMKDWALQRNLRIQAWDLDGDMWIDVRRFEMPDGSDAENLMITEARAEDLLPWTAGDWSPWE